jgi:hypothetical protein
MIILYHYTDKQSRLLISWTGLEAYVKDNERHMTLGTPVVWLTKESSLPIITQADIDHYQQRHSDRMDEYIKARREGGVPWEVGQPILVGRTERVVVDISRSSKRLVFYKDFLRKHKHNILLEWLPPSALKNWYVYFGDIAPAKLSPITIAEARVGLQIQIGLPEHAAEQKAAYQRMIDDMAGANDDTAINWNLREAA